jgi:hypothetical protein
MKENESKIIELKGCSPNAMQLILDCIYTDKVELTDENVQELLAAASLFQLPGDCLICEETIKIMRSEKNII